MVEFLFGKKALWTEAIFLLRIWCGVIFIYHGMICFDPEGMKGFAVTLDQVNIPFPLVSAYLCKVTEFFGGICLTIGFIRRLAALFMIINMWVATFIYNHGLVFNNGHTTFILLICSLTIFFSAADKFTIDRYVRKTVLLLPLLVITSCGYGQRADLPSFDIVNVKVCNSPGSVETADFNRDGFADLVIASESDSSVTVLLGAGHGKFSPSAGSPFYAGNIPNDIAIADLNGDGNPDMAIANHERKHLTILIGDGSGRFSASPQSPLATKGIPHTHGVAIGDFNSDHRPDIVTDSWGNNQLEVFFGDRSNLFEKEGKFFKVGKRPYQRHRVSDINGDGIDDIVTTNLESNNATILLCDGSGDFYQAPGSPVPCGDAPFGIAIGDLNADKRPDLAVIDSPSSTGGSKGVDGLTILIGDGRGKFTAVKGSPFKAGKIPNRVAIADVNRDGVNDIVTSDNGSNEIYLFLMNKDGTMLSTGSIKVGHHPKGIAITGTEIVVCNQEDDTISILTTR